MRVLHRVIFRVLVLLASVASGAGFLWARQEPDLETVLNRSAARIEEFWRQYSSVRSTERVLQTRLDADGDVLDETRSTYDYLMVMNLHGDDLTFEESRIEQDPPAETDPRAFLATTGFSTLLLVFHPYFQTSFDYSWDTTASPEDPVLRVDFRAITGRRSPSVLRLEGRDYPIEWSGTAWIDAESAMITRIETRLSEPMSDLGLEELTARTDYGTVRMGSSDLEYWLPSSTVIEARSEQQTWRNEHDFDDYQVFSVESDLEIEEPEGPR
jgi:hypothetical protein